ncbi:MAG: hypothetical protein WBY94_30185 [Polyangiaceae bacterium]
MTAQECPKCLRLRRGLPEGTARCCSLCLRWQFLYQASFVEFAGAVFKHLAGVACGAGAWCLDTLEAADVDGRGQSETARACAHNAHVHAPGIACKA